jgi:predicted O-methyltransferase YrrM
MKIPHLMAFQLESFNGDSHIRKEFLRLKEKFNLKDAVETGTCFGSTTMFLSENFETVYTVENNFEYLSIAHERFKEKNIQNVVTEFGGSAELLYSMIADNNLGDNTMFFLDAHWSNRCPLLEELECISLAGIKPVIAIHDFKTGDNSLGYDSYNGQDFTFEWIRKAVQDIYGESYGFHYNTEAEGAKRGIIYIYPVND